MCKSCKKKANVQTSLPSPLPKAYTAIKPAKETAATVLITPRSPVTLDIPQGSISLSPGNVIKLPREIVDELLSEGAPIWELSKP